MPDDQERIDRLNRAIERLVSGQPVPVLKEGDLDELLRLAHQLRVGLPHDTPDPTFIDELRTDLFNPHPRLVQLPPRPKPRKYPLGAFAGVLGVVLIATVSVGVLAINGGASSRNLLRNDLPLWSATPTANLTAQFAAISSTTPTATEEQVAVVPVDSVEPSPTEAPLPEPTSQPDPPDTPTSAESDPPAAPDPSATATSTPESTPTSAEEQATTQLLAMDLPPVDDAHVERGPLETVEAVGTPVPDDVRFELATELPKLAATAGLYHLSTPHVDPQWLLERIAQSLGIQGEIASDADAADGRETYQLSEGSTVVFSWTPRSGAFSCSLPTPEDVGEGVSDIVDHALTWLRNLGYPIDPEAAQPVVTQIEPDAWRVEVPLSDLPNPAVGHPLNVSLTLNTQGQVLQASGYWVKVSQSMDVALMSAEQAWQALQDGSGYWPSGPLPDVPGVFSVESFGVSYVLTLDEQGELVLQPVVTAGGAFHGDDGSLIPGLKVLIQAATQPAT